MIVLLIQTALTYSLIDSWKFNSGSRSALDDELVAIVPIRTDYDLGMYNKKNVDYAYLLWENFIYQIENKNTKKGNAMYYPRFTKLVINFVMDKVLSILKNIGTIPPKTKGSKKKADTDTTTMQKPPIVPKEKKEKKSGKGKAEGLQELETISKAVLTEAEQLKIIIKRSRKETHSYHASGSGVDEGTGVTPRVLDAPDYGLGMMISLEINNNEVDGMEVEGESRMIDATYGRGPSNECLGRRKIPMAILKEEMKLKLLEDNFSELRQTNQYAEALSSIPGIVDHYLAKYIER
ncbi:hypothetical protein Tco_0685850 [Tanacetum coccineum]